MRFTNNVLDAVYAGLTMASSCFKTTCNWISGYHNQWFFLSGRSIPVPAPNFAQFKNGIPTNVSWVFNTESNILSSIPYSSPRTKLRCLSISLVEGTAENSLDSIIPEFTLYLHDELPPPTTLAACWAIRSGIWHSPEAKPEFHIIDRMGEEHIIPLFGDYDEAAWGNALGIQVRRAEATEQSEPESDEEVEATEEQPEATEEQTEEQQSEESDSTIIEPPLIQEFFPLVKN